MLLMFLPEKKNKINYLVATATQIDSLSSIWLIS